MYFPTFAYMTDGSNLELQYSKIATKYLKLTKYRLMNLLNWRALMVLKGVIEAPQFTVYGHVESYLRL